MKAFNSRIDNGFTVLHALLDALVLEPQAFEYWKEIGNDEFNLNIIQFFFEGPESERLPSAKKIVNAFGNIPTWRDENGSWWGKIRETSIVLHNVTAPEPTLPKPLNLS